MAVKVPVLMHSPENSEGERQDLYPFTSTDEVLMADDESKTLTEALGEISGGAMEISTTQPDHGCIWFRPDTEISGNDSNNP